MGADRAELEIHEQPALMETRLRMFSVKRNNGKRDAGEPLLRGGRDEGLHAVDLLLTEGRNKGM